MDTTMWIFVAVALVLLAIVLALVVMRRRHDRNTQLRERFGDEYERRVEDAGSERQARKDLTGVQERRKELEIRPLAAASRERYIERWQVVQTDFVDRPGHAVDEANDLVNDVMRERGYPVDDFDTRADMVAADHSEVVQDYRAATDARRRHHAAGAEATTEELRRAMVHYRALFERLVGEPGEGDATDRQQTPESVDLREQDEHADRTRGRHSG